MKYLLSAVALLCLFLFLVLGDAMSAFGADLPDPMATPGAINLGVMQSNIQTTICVPGWTKTIRPPASYTTKLKLKQLHTLNGPYRSELGAAAFEEDHLISLEIGGNPTDSRNLWPQHWSAPNGAHEKDALENKLHRLVCVGTITLIEAQQAVATDWITAHRKYVLGR
jgi:hypothetical protein